MFRITVALIDYPTPWGLFFETPEGAEKTWNELTASPITHHSPSGKLTLADEFGQIALVDRSRIAGAMFEDLDKSMLAHIEYGLHNARTQAKAQQRAVNDPILKTAALTRGQGPGIFNPVPGNGSFHG